jgi:hypothetical protein
MRVLSSEDLKVFVEDFVDFLDSLEACVVKLRRQIERLFGEVKARVPEETFSILKWDDEKGERLGDFQAAYKNKNVLENWQHAYNILKQANAVIGNPFHLEGYQYRYWIYPDKYNDRIFRKKLSEAKS